MSSPESIVHKGPFKRFTVESLPIRVYLNQPDLAYDAARDANEYLQAIIARNGSAAVILATGNSQIEFLRELAKMPGVDWKKVTLFHMDEYLGISQTHKASFRKYLRERVENLLQPKVFRYLEGDTALPLDECARYSHLLRAQDIDLCCLGVGENGHLAFNDPPVADFKDPHLVKLVKLDDSCKMQQVREGHFPSLEAVPPYAITLTIPALCSARKMICIAPENRKANAVKIALQGPVSTECPASILRRMSHCTLYLDQDSASLL